MKNLSNTLVSLFDIMKTYGKVTRIQAWTLLWESRESMERALASNPEARLVFINLVRSELESSPPNVSTRDREKVFEGRVSDRDREKIHE